MTLCYSLLDIVIKGYVSQARPIEWDTPDADGFGNNASKEPVQATGWHTTCPFCAQLIEFHRDDLFVAVDDTDNNIKCDKCEAGSPIKRPQFQAVPTQDTLIARDPLPSWSYAQVPIDLERLVVLDAELSKAL